MTVSGNVDPGFEPVLAAFEANLATDAEVGAAVSVYRQGRKIVDLWGGTAEPDTGRPWQADTLQGVFSTTKGATAICAHLLAQRHELDLDAPVAHYWPEFAVAGKERIPVRWLLSHQAGVPALDRRLPLAEALAWHPMVAAIAAQSPAWEPGTAHGYHALTYGWLVGEVVRRVSGSSLGAYFAREVAAPLALDFHIGLPASERHRVSPVIAAPGHAQAMAAMDPTSLITRAMIVTDPPIDLNDPAVQAAEVPAVNGFCTARSLARLYASLIGGVDGGQRLLDADTLERATAVQSDGIDRVIGVPSRIASGFGLPSPQLPWYSPAAFGFGGHGGSLGYADPGTGIAFGYVMNRLHDGPTPDERAAGLIRALHASLRDEQIARGHAGPAA